LQPFSSKPFIFSSAAHTHKTIILLVFLCGFETWTLILREDHRLSAFENRVPRGIFESKGDEVMRGRRKWYNEEFNYLYYSPSQGG
jgi:hypothetical protein